MRLKAHCQTDGFLSLCFSVSDFVFVNGGDLFYQTVLLHKGWYESVCSTCELIEAVLVCVLVCYMKLLQSSLLFKLSESIF